MGRKVLRNIYDRVSRYYKVKRLGEKIAVTPAFFWVIEKQLLTEYGIKKRQIIRSSDRIVPCRANMGSIRVSCVDDDCYDANDLVPDYVIPENRMEEFYFGNDHRVVSKWWYYFEVYNTFFQKFVCSSVRILEIGVCKGGSLQTWKNYFGENATVIGIDIDAGCEEFEEENIHICIGSQADKDFLLKVSEKWEPFDIVMYDGSHEMDHQILTFETLFPLLRENGVFICEDCHSSYSSRYNGAIRKKILL